MKKLLILLVLLVLAGCVIDVNPGEEHFEMNLISVDSLRDVYGQIKIAFTDEILENDSLFDFNPAFLAYRESLNTSRDTVTLYLYEDLDYNTGYTIHPTDNLKSRKRDIIKSTISFRTVKGECEPNNNVQTADTIQANRPYAGYVNPASDEDFYLVNVKTADKPLAIIISNLTADLNMAVLKKNGNSVLASSSSRGRSSDTITVQLPDTGYYPVRIAADTLSRIGGRYHIRAYAR